MRGDRYTSARDYHPPNEYEVTSNAESNQPRRGSATPDCIKRMQESTQPVTKQHKPNLR